MSKVSTHKATAAVLARLRQHWPEERVSFLAQEAMEQAARHIEAQQAVAIVAGLMADLVAQPEPGNPHRLDSVKAAVAFLERFATVPGRGYDSGAVFRARLVAGHIGGRFKAPFLGADLEPLGRAAADLAEAERAEAGALQMRDRCKGGLALGGSGWTPADLDNLQGQLTRARKATKAAKATHAAEVQKARDAGLIQ